jgi:hypothetical protein
MPSSKRSPEAAENADDLAVFDDRADEPRLKFDAVVSDLKKRGMLQ